MADLTLFRASKHAPERLPFEASEDRNEVCASQTGQSRNWNEVVFAEFQHCRGAKPPFPKPRVPTAAMVPAVAAFLCSIVGSKNAKSSIPKVPAAVIPNCPRRVSIRSPLNVTRTQRPALNGGSLS